MRIYKRVRTSMFERHAMFFRRYRWPIFLLVAVVFLVTIAPLSARFAPITDPIFPVSDHKHSTPSTTVSSAPGRDSHACPTAPPTPVLAPDTQGRFDWRTVQSHYPVEHFAPLPVGKPSPRPSVQHGFRAELTANKGEIASRKDAVREVFQRCWKSYKDRAWTKDELAPISGGPKDTFGSWGATLVDSLDTLWIMDLKQDFAEAVDAAVQIDFGPKIDGEINVFETIIRYLGGFLGAYDVAGCHDARLLNKAIEVADMAYAAFDTPNRMPVSRWSPKKAVDGEEQLPAESMLIAEAASASVEFTRLSQLTGDMRYFDAISRVTDVLDEQQHLTKLPGMWPISVNMRKPDLTFDGFFGLGAMADSVYEYLPKMHQLLNGIGPVAAQYQKMYESAMSTAIAHTLFRPMTHDKADILIASANVNGERDNKGSTLYASLEACSLSADGSSITVPISILDARFPKVAPGHIRMHQMGSCQKCSRWLHVLHCQHAKTPPSLVRVHSARSVMGGTFSDLRRSSRYFICTGSRARQNTRILRGRCGKPSVATPKPNSLTLLLETS